MAEYIGDISIVLYFWFLQYGIVYLIVMCIISGIVGFCVLTKLKKPCVALMVGVFVGVIVPCIIIGLLFQSDFVKSRKHVDVDWMMGKTIDEVRVRYSYPNNLNQSILTKEIDGEEYVFCVREIFNSDFYDVDGELLYYVQTDDFGRIIEIKSMIYGTDFSASDYDECDRWGGMKVYYFISFLPGF